jgi:hypothetical protein
MAVITWTYADRQATPVNYAKMDIANEELIFFGRGQSNNYRQLMSQKADEYGGQAFITEYAAPTRELVVVHPLLQDLSSRYAYVTRLNTVISPEEMTVDPIFDYDPQLKDVSNIRDLTNMKGVFDCDRSELQNALASESSVVSLSQSGGAQDTAEAAGDSGASTDSTGSSLEAAGSSGAGTDSMSSSLSVGTLAVGIALGGAGVLLVAVLVYLGVVMRRRRASL